MALDRTALTATAAPKRRPAATAAVKRGAGGTAARSLQQRVGSRATQALVARSVESAKAARLASRQSKSSEGGKSEAGQRHDLELARGEVVRIVDWLRLRAAGQRQRTRENAVRVCANLLSTGAMRSREVAVATVATIAGIRAASAQARLQIANTIRTRRGEAAQAVVLAKSALAQHLRSEMARLPREIGTRETAFRQSARQKSEEARRMGREEGDRGAKRNEADAQQARLRGRTRAGAYPKTKRGQVQASAALRTANEVAGEISQNTDGIRQFANDAAADIAPRFSESAEKTIGQIREQLPGIREPMAQIESTTRTTLDGMLRAANAALSALQSHAWRAIAAIERRAIAQANETRQRVTREIDSAARVAAEGVSRHVFEAGRRVDQNVENTAAALLLLGNPDPVAARGIAAQMIDYLRESGDIIAQSVGDFERDAVNRFAGAVDAARNAFRATVWRAAGGLARIRTAIQKSTQKITTDVRERSGVTLRQASLAMAEVITGVMAMLDRAIREALATFVDLLSRTRRQVRATLNEGLGHNVEALAQLGPSMTEAADDAAWEFDHPILSFVAGLALAVLLVVALVVIVLVGAEIIIAGLAVAIGAAAAEAVAIVAGIAIAAYMVHRSYAARRARLEQEGGTESRGMTLLASAGELVGITQTVEGFTQEGLTPFERGWKIGSGIATAASWWLGPKLTGRLSTLMPRLRWVPKWIKAPVREQLPPSIEESIGGGTSEGLPMADVPPEVVRPPETTTEPLAETTAAPDRITGQLSGAPHAGLSTGPGLPEIAKQLATAERIGSALKADPTHRAASLGLDDVAKAGQSFSLTGGDGVTRTLIQAPGGMNGKAGIFEYIINKEGQVTHQRFIEGGVINGVPNQKPPL